jgi:hypothetical protein
MPRMNDWQQEKYDALRVEAWSLRGPNQIVKVLPSDCNAARPLGGYITVGRHLLGKTPQQIEKALGLSSGLLSIGAKIYRFTRLPMIGEYEYELTAHYPDGLAFVPGHSHPDYLPGDRTIHQWRIKKGMEIPVDSKNCLDLKPGHQFPYGWLQP